MRVKDNTRITLRGLGEVWMKKHKAWPLLSEIAEIETEEAETGGELLFQPFSHILIPIMNSLRSGFLQLKEQRVPMTGRFPWSVSQSLISKVPSSRNLGGITISQKLCYLWGSRVPRHPEIHMAWASHSEPVPVYTDSERCLMSHQCEKELGPSLYSGILICMWLWEAKLL